MSDCTICGQQLKWGDPSFERNNNKYYVCSSCRQALILARTNPETKKIVLKKLDMLEPVTSKDLRDIFSVYSDAEIEAEKRAKEREQQLKQAVINARNSIFISSGYNFEGYRIVSYLGPISGEAVMGTGFLSEFSAGISDILGERSTAFAKKLKEARAYALDDLREECIKCGGNAIIGVDFDYVTFSNNMIGVIANGTAVAISR